MVRSKIIDKLMAMFGDIKIFKYPLFLVYDPGSYRVKGPDIRELISILQPGDILLRSYDHYLDGRFIPGTFSHAGIYFGEITEDHRSSAGTRIHNLKRRQRALDKHFVKGPQMVIHAMAEGVFAEDILTFSRCDKIAVLRLPEAIRQSAMTGGAVFPIHDLNSAEKVVVERLKKGAEIDKSDVIPLILQEALANLGRPYDFNFDFANFSRLSCSELVYFCLKSVAGAMNFYPQKVSVGFLHRSAITPDAFLSQNFNKVWASASVREQCPNLHFPAFNGALV